MILVINFFYTKGDFYYERIHLQKILRAKTSRKFPEASGGFASMSDTVQEEMFRAGFYCGLNINDVFFDPDRPALDNGYILVRKEDVNLDWYQKVKAEIAKEAK